MTILDTMPKGGGGGSGLSREEIVDKICEELLSKVGGVGGKASRRCRCWIVAIRRKEGSTRACKRVYAYDVTVHTRGPNGRRGWAACLTFCIACSGIERY